MDIDNSSSDYKSLMSIFFNVVLCLFVFLGLVISFGIVEHVFVSSCFLLLLLYFFQSTLFFT